MTDESKFEHSLTLPHPSPPLVNYGVHTSPPRVVFSNSGECANLKTLTPFDKLRATPNPSPRGRGEPDLAPFSLWEKGWG
jgi:hypothetical protein